MNIALLTLPLNGRNYGGMIQCYALCRVLRCMGHNVVVLDRRKNRASFSRRILSRIKQFVYKRVFCVKGKYFDWNYVCRDLDYFISANMSVTKPLYSSLSLEKEFLHGSFDAVVFGSDQIWRRQYVSSVLDFWGGFIPQDSSVRRVVYAASFGTDGWDYTEEETLACRNLSSAFNAISVREHSGVELCRKYLGLDVEMMLDPSLLLHKSDYVSLLDPEEKCLPDAALSAYILDMDSEKEQMLALVGSYLRTDSILRLSILDYEDEGRRNGTFRYPSVSRWLSVYEKGSFVITDSYHGCIFSILFNKPFVVIANHQRGLTRFVSLLSMFGLQYRIVESVGDLQSRLSEVLAPIDYDAINVLLAEKRNAGIDFLNKSLRYGK